jgi:hypothetical protein
MAIPSAEDGTLEAGWRLVARTEALEGWDAQRGMSFVEVVGVGSAGSSDASTRRIR